MEATYGKKKFLPVSKNLFSLKKKGIWLENIAGYFYKNGTDIVIEDFYIADNFSYGETLYSVTLHTVPFKYLWCQSALGGLPDLIVFCKDNKDWLKLHSILRSADLIR